MHPGPSKEDAGDITETALLDPEAAAADASRETKRLALQVDLLCGQLFIRA